MVPYVNYYHRNWLPSKVWPNCQKLSATLLETTVWPSLVVVMKDSVCPYRTLPWCCQFWPQFCCIGTQDQFVPSAITDTCCTSPAPPTFVISTNRNQGLPLMVKRNPPCLSHGTLHTRYCNRYKITIGSWLTNGNSCT